MRIRLHSATVYRSATVAVATASAAGTRVYSMVWQLWYFCSGFKFVLNTVLKIKISNAEAWSLLGYVS